MSKVNLKEVFSSLAFSKIIEPVFSDKKYVITDYGAVGDGIHNNAGAINKAIVECSASGGGTVLIPSGLWLTGPISLRSNVNLHLESGALVSFSKNYDDYPLIVSSYEGLETVRHTSPINGRDLENVAITGSGVFDGSGDAWRPVKKEKLTESQWEKLLSSGGYVYEHRYWYPTKNAFDGIEFYKRVKGKSLSIEECRQYADFLRPNLLSLINCKNVLLDGPTFQNSPAWCLHPLYCENIIIRNIFVRNPWYSQNGDALDLEACKNAHIHDSKFDAGDDGICIKSGKNAEGRLVGKPCENVIVERCTVFHGHGGVVIGSEMSGGVKNMYVSDCQFLGTDVGLRFKSCRGRGGVVENIYIENIKMKDIAREAIIFSTIYELKKGTEDIPVPVSEETPEFRNFYLKDIYCTGATYGISICGLAEMPVRNIQMDNVNISSKNGLYCTNATEISINNLNLKAESDVLINIHNSTDIEIENVKNLGSSKELINITGDKSKNVNCR